MIAAWEASDKLSQLDSPKKVSNHCRNLPPYLREQRAQATCAAKEQEACDRKRAREAAIAAAIANGKRGGKAAGRGTRGRRQG